MKLSIDMSRAGGPATGLIPCIPATTQPGGGIPLKTPGGRAPARPSCRPGPICDRNPIPSCPGSADATPGRIRHTIAGQRESHTIRPPPVDRGHAQLAVLVVVAGVPNQHVWRRDRRTCTFLDCRADAVAQRGFTSDREAHQEEGRCGNPRRAEERLQASAHRAAPGGWIPHRQVVKIYHPALHHA